jgi:phosphate starvation-inducible PhoH-like protein
VGFFSYGAFMGKRRVYKDSKEATYTKPRSINQEQYVSYLNDLSKTYVFATGAAGCGKTLFAVEKGIEFFKEKHFNKIVITRPAVSVDEEHGFLPGTLQEKMDPWVRPILDVFKEHFSLDYLSYLIDNEKIEISPLAYIRGRTFKYSWIIADEMQNATVSQTKSLLTRLGTKSKMVITGDLQQVDSKIPHNGLKDFLSKIPQNSKYIKHIQFSKDDIERHPAIKEILSIYGDE